MILHESMHRVWLVGWMVGRTVAERTNERKELTAGLSGSFAISISLPLSLLHFLSLCVWIFCSQLLSLTIHPSIHAQQLSRKEVGTRSRFLCKFGKLASSELGGITGDDDSPIILSNLLLLVTHRTPSYTYTHEKASAYGKCIAAQYQDVARGACGKEFEQFRECVQKAVRSDTAVISLTH